MSSYELTLVFFVCSHVMTLTLLACKILSSSFQQDSQSSEECLAADLCICFHLSVDEGSLLTVAIVTNLISGETSSGYLYNIARSLSWDHTCRFVGVSAAANFISTQLQNEPQSRHLFHYFPLFSIPQPNILDSLSLPRRSLLLPLPS